MLPPPQPTRGRGKLLWDLEVGGVTQKKEEEEEAVRKKKEEEAAVALGGN
jgi:hypothetical protein